MRQLLFLLLTLMLIYVYHSSIIVLAGDVSPVDVISFMPVVCEEAGLPYCYIPTKEVIIHEKVLMEW